MQLLHYLQIYFEIQIKKPREHYTATIHIKIHRKAKLYISITELPLSQ